MSEAGYVAGNPRWNGHPRLVAVSGCSGGGKSMLLAEMAARGHAVFPEPGRQVAKEEALIGGPAAPDRDLRLFSERCLARASYFFNIADASNGFVFFDRGIVDAVRALERTGGAPTHALAAARAYRYGRVFLVPPWPELFAGDAERRHGFAAAEAEYRDLLEGYPAHGYGVTVIPKGTVAERADFLEAALAGV